MAQRHDRDAVLIKQTLEDDPAFCQWFTGFFDGEGCFALGLAGGSWHIRLRIALRADDIGVVRLLKHKLGGSIGKLPSGRVGQHASVNWELVTCFGCLAVCDVFDRFPLRSKKAREYAIWRQAAVLKAGGPYSKWNPLPDAPFRKMSNEMRELKRFRLVA